MPCSCADMHAWVTFETSRRQEDVLEVAPSAGGSQARDILLGVLRGIIRGLMQRKVQTCPVLACEASGMTEAVISF